MEPSILRDAVFIYKYVAFVQAITPPHFLDDQIIYFIGIAFLFLPTAIQGKRYLKTAHLRPNILVQ